MFHVCIDSSTTRNIVGFETGTRASFDTRHAGDPLWVFLDKDKVQYQLPLNVFLLTPTVFFFDKDWDIQKRNV